MDYNALCTQNLPQLTCICYCRLLTTPAQLLTARQMSQTASHLPGLVLWSPAAVPMGFLQLCSLHSHFYSSPITRSTTVSRLHQIRKSQRHPSSSEFYLKSFEGYQFASETYDTDDPSSIPTRHRLSRHGKSSVSYDTGNDRGTTFVSDHSHHRHSTSHMAYAKP